MRRDVCCSTPSKVSWYCRTSTTHIMVSAAMAMRRRTTGTSSASGMSCTARRVDGNSGGKTRMAYPWGCRLKRAWCSCSGRWFGLSAIAQCSSRPCSKARMPNWLWPPLSSSRPMALRLPLKIERRLAIRAGHAAHEQDARCAQGRRLARTPASNAVTAPVPTRRPVNLPQQRRRHSSGPYWNSLDGAG